MANEPIKSYRIGVPKRKSPEALQAERVREWEDRENQSFDEVAESMTAAALTFFDDHPKHFSREIDRMGSDPIRFTKRLKMAMTDSLLVYIDSELGFSASQEKKESEQWSKAYNNLRQIHRLLRGIPLQKAKEISSSLARHDLPGLANVIHLAIRRGMMISLTKKNRYETRGNKRSGISLLTLELFENLEWRLARDFARSFAVSPSKKELQLHPERKATRDFVNLDTKLIYWVVRSVKPNAVIETVQSALKSMPSKKSEKK